MSRPPLWTPPVPLSPQEERLLRLCKKAPLFVFLRSIRHQLFASPFQERLASLYKPVSRGQPPIPPALLAMAGLLQAVTGVSDQEAVRLSATDRCWQMVLGTLGEDEPPFSQGTLAGFRARLISHDFDRVLLEQTVEWARLTKRYSARHLRAAFDASPLWGAGRVEDTFNLLGHAARDIVHTIAHELGLTETDAAQRAGIPLLMAPSIKAGLDIDWGDTAQRTAALARLLAELSALQRFVALELGAASHAQPLAEQLATLNELLGQDLEPEPNGTMRLKDGTARERRISVTDPEMRHGRKTKARRFDGYKRHVARDRDSRLVLAAAVTPANRPEAEAAPMLVADIERQGFTMAALDIDRGYLTAPIIEERRNAGTQVICRAPPLQNGGRYTKADFKLDFASRTLTCPAGVSVAFVVGGVARFAGATCGACAQRQQCTRAAGGRAVSIHPREEFFVKLRERQRTPEGRAELRERVHVEHGLARLEQSQGERARYRGSRKNVYDVRRHAALVNLYEAMAAA